KFKEINEAYAYFLENKEKILKMLPLGFEFHPFAFKTGKNIKNIKNYKILLHFDDNRAIVTLDIENNKVYVKNIVFEKEPYGITKEKIIEKINLNI
ncbi:MAG: hypothetical protein ACP5IV_07410, partial [Caldisericia bacterium]